MIARRPFCLAERISRRKTRRERNHLRRLYMPFEVLLNDPYSTADDQAAAFRVWKSECERIERRQFRDGLIVILMVLIAGPLVVIWSLANG